MGGGWRPEGSAVGPLRVLLAASLVVPLVLFATFAWINYRSDIAEVRQELVRTSQIAREHAIKVLEAQNEVGARVDDLVRDRTETELRASEPAVHDALKEIAADLPDISSVMLIDRSGVPVASAAVFPAPQDLNFSADPFFRAVENGYRGTFVDLLQIGALSHRPFWGFARAWNGPGGRFEGVIVVGVLPAVFENFYRAMIGSNAAGRGEIIGLVRSDGQIILRYPPLDATSGLKLSADSPFLRSVAAQPEHGTFYGRASGVGAVGRLYAYEKVSGYALYVVAGQSMAVITADWARFMASHLVFGIPATLALFLITLTALRRTQQKDETLAQLRAEMQRREEAEAALLQRQRLDAVGQMTGGIAHDFNNLLTVVMGNLEILDRRANDPDRVRRIAANAMLAARRGAEVTNKLLAFSRRQLVRPEMIDLNHRLLEFKPLLDHAAEASSLQLDLDPDTSQVLLDPGQFEAAVINLVANARDAVASAGRIVISTSNVRLSAADRQGLTAGDYVRVAVADDGPGMDAATVARAFEPFFTTKDAGKGTGLGLSQVYGFAKQSGGDVSIASAPGMGTTVEILLPRASSSAPAIQAGPELLPLRQAREGEVILVVEDEPAVRQLAIESLRDLGYETLDAANAADALDLLRGETRVDVMFSDVIMPGGMNGLQLAVEARRLRPGLKVLLASGYAPTIFGGNVPQDVPLITKPYNQNQLATQLLAVLSS